MFLSDIDLKKAAKAFISIFVPLLFGMIVWRTVGICYETNDDVIITKILSGIAAGQPDPHTIYQNYLLALPLHFLYRISANVPWYGGLLILCHVIMYASLFQSIWSNAKTLLEHALFGGIVCCFAVGNYYMTAALQFTSTAALLAAAGYCCLFLNRRFKTGLSLFFGFELMAYLIRSQSMLMIQPFGCATGLALYLVCDGGQIRTRCKRAIAMVSAVFVVIAIGYTGSLMGYHGEEWSTYFRFNESLTKLTDYYGCPPYEDVKDILDQYGIHRPSMRHFVVTPLWTMK